MPSPDPAREAQAHIAYERPERAREVLVKALAREPSREDLRALLDSLAAPKGVEVRIESRWFMPGFLAGFAIWIGGLAMAEWGLLPVGAAVMVGAIAAEARRQRRDPKARKALAELSKHYKEKP